MKQKSAFRVFLSIFTVLSLILSACSPADENHGEELKEMIKNDSKIQRVTLGDDFDDHTDKGVKFTEEEKSAIIDYITSMDICVTPEEDFEMVYGGSWLNIYLSDDKIIHLRFFGDNFYFYDLKEYDGTLYHDSTENYDRLLDYLSDVQSFD